MRKFGLIAVIVLITSFVSGQTYIGLKSAYTMSNVSFMPDQDTKMLFGSGFDFGLAYKYYNAKYVGIQAELYTTKRGYRLTVDTTFLAAYKRVNTYIELPLFVQFRLNLKFAYIHVNAGPYISYLISAEEGDNTSGSFKLKKIDFNILRDNRFDYGLIGGVGLSHDFKWGTIQAEARVSYGFADLFDYTYTNMPKQSKSVTESVNVGYYYKFGDVK